MTPPEDGSNAHLGWRMGELEKRVERMADHIDTRLSDLSDKIDALGFVRTDVYAAEQRAADAAHKALEQRVDETDKRAMWAIALVCVVTISAIIAAILSTAGVFS